MHALIEYLAGGASLALEAVAILVILYGATEAVLDISLTVRGSRAVTRRSIWLHFARWLLLGLEFALAADIVRTAVSPTWNDLGQLATIAAIRTFLNTFLERDIHDVREMSLEAVARPDAPFVARDEVRV
jgi:uncharacterized membrane protein